MPQLRLLVRCSPHTGCVEVYPLDTEGKPIRPLPPRPKGLWEKVAEEAKKHGGYYPSGWEMTLGKETT